MTSFERPLVLFLIIPLFFILIFMIRRTFIKFGNRTEKMNYIQSKKRLRIFMFFSRMILFSLILLAIASPFELENQVRQGNPSLSILVDSSNSFGLFDSSSVEELRAEIAKEIPVKIKNISSPERSDLGNGILTEIQGNDNVLIVTDGNNNYGRSFGDIMLFASSINTTISALQLNPVYDDLAVRIIGPSRTTADIDNNFEVVVENVGGTLSYEISLHLDGRKVLGETSLGSKTFQYSTRLTEGYHELQAQIAVADHFSENNIYYKSVKVEPKPRIAFVSQKSSPAAQIFNQLYVTSTFSSIPQDLNSYSAVVLNDMRVSNSDSSRLTDYVLDGNGLFVIGGQNSFDKGGYAGSRFENMLPAIVGTGTKDIETDVNVVVVLDISGSSGAAYGGQTVGAVQKAIAINIFRDLRNTDKVGVIAFNVNSYEVAELQRKSLQFETEDKISRLVFDGGTKITEGIRAARDMLLTTTGSKNIILISDGKSTGTALGEDRQAAANAAIQGIKVYTVGVGPGTDTARMKAMADAGNGIYFEPDQTERIKILFGDSEEEEENLNVENIDSSHFITSSYNPNGRVLGFNFVLPKSNANMLLATADGNPLLSVWKFGLGRVAVLSTDDGSAWAGELLNQQNSQIYSRTTNWVVGDLSRNKAFDVSIEDINLGEELQINVISSTEPTSGYSFSKIGDRRYRAITTPDEEGFMEILGASVAINPPKEYQYIGMNPQLETMVQTTNGQMFTQSDAKEIIDKVKADSRRVTTRADSYSWIFAIAAIVVFLLELAIRRILERKQRK